MSVDTDAEDITNTEIEHPGNDNGRDTTKSLKDWQDEIAANRAEWSNNNDEKEIKKEKADKSDRGE